MLWVTFGYAEAPGMTIMVGANMKDENCFAERGALGAGAGVSGADYPPNQGRGGPAGLLGRDCRATAWCP